jgi:hypothetical protein
MSLICYRDASVCTENIAFTFMVDFDRENGSSVFFRIFGIQLDDCVLHVRGRHTEKFTAVKIC